MTLFKEVVPRLKSCISTVKYQRNFFSPASSIGRVLMLQCFVSVNWCVHSTGFQDIALI